MNAFMSAQDVGLLRRLALSIGVFVGSLIIAPKAHAAFHLWSIQELYTNSSGSLQFIELIDNVGSQNFVGSHAIQVSDTSNLHTHSFTFPNNLAADPPGTTLLIGTAGLHAAGGPTPDFIMPDGFLFLGGGNISFFNASGPYSALPTNGMLALNYSTGLNIVNNPKNSAGHIGQVVVPEPAAIMLVAAGALSCLLHFLLRRRVASSTRMRIS
jgi:hypothetical protein